MKIIPIYNKSLFVVHLPNQRYDELKRNLNNWKNTEFVTDFVFKNYHDVQEKISAKDLIKKIQSDAFRLENLLEEIYVNKLKRFEDFFKPLDNREYKEQILSKQKGRKNYLRLYAIKVDKDCFIIVGGAIKFHLLMEERPHTATELQKIEQCKDYLKDIGIVDKDSLLEYYEFGND